MIKLLHLFKESLKEETRLLKEVGENTYSFSEPDIEVISPSKNFVTYTFENKNGTEYEVTFESTYFKNSPDFKWETEISSNPFNQLPSPI